MSVITISSTGSDVLDHSAHTYFISDLHLDPARTDTIDLSLRFFAHVQGARALFVMGDLFEYWLGDDGADPRLTHVYDAMRAVSESGTDVYLMHGNRDFLIGEQFSSVVSATLITDDHVEVELGAARYSLLHGDTLCTDDVDYLRLRQMVRDPHWQSEFLALTIDERIAQAQALRDQSRDAVSSKSAGIMDVNDDAVQNHAVQFPNDGIIHGHTHRPVDHTGTHRRLVLGNWKVDHAMIAKFDGEQLYFERFD
ncbi:UNVERIFIED_CONTAM: hypothetical protein GTU68_044237 [Idotea baltica]|nr:hypothetical protein [Idotea baltica]